MFTRTREESMRTSSFFLASTLLVVGAAGLMGVGLKAAADYNPMRSVGNSIAFGFTMPAKVVGGTLAAPAPVQAATFTARFAALEQK